MKILVAEDSSMFRGVLSRLFKSLGHEAIMAETGLTAWKAFEKQYFPVVVTDWHMPAMDGMVLTKMIRAKPHDKYTYVILLTSDGGDENYHEAMNAGADDFLVKSADIKQLSARLLVAQRIVGMQDHMSRLEQLLSVCSYCKDVREGDRWVPIERYVSDNIGAQSSHGICPRCYTTRVKPELERIGIAFDEPEGLEPTPEPE